MESRRAQSQTTQYETSKHMGLRPDLVGHDSKDRTCKSRWVAAGERLPCTASTCRPRKATTQWSRQLSQFAKRSDSKMHACEAKV